MLNPMEPFNYDEAFSRNIGWVTEVEQEALRGKRVAIAGLGGVGGVHLLTLARLGVGRFAIADPDRFDLVNFNRQVGATTQTLGRSKVATLATMAREINPELDIRTFEDGVTPENLDTFLDGADVYVDGLDFFAFDARERVFAACAAKGIPAVTVAPIGMGAALLNFMPGRMTFEKYFRLRGAERAREGAPIPPRPFPGNAASTISRRPFAGEFRRAARSIDDHRLSALRGHRGGAGTQDRAWARPGSGRATGPAFRCVHQSAPQDMASSGQRKSDSAFHAAARAAAISALRLLRCGP